LVSAKVKIGGFEAPARWRGAEADFKADLNDLAAVGEVCKTIGADTCHTIVSPTSDTLPMHENFKFHADRLAELANGLATQGLKLAVGFQAATDLRSATAPHQFIHDANAMLELLSAIRSDNVGLLLDVWNWHVGGGTLSQIKALKPGQVVSVRLADVAADADLSKITSHDRMLPGDGNAVDIAGYLALLDSMGFTGPITPFPHPTQFAGRTRESNVQRATAALDALWVSAGLTKPAAPPTIPPASKV
jgi:sugar phosphate isomerase/epimerase